MSSSSRASARASTRTPHDRSLHDRSLPPVFDPEPLARLDRLSRADKKTGCRIWKRKYTHNGYGELHYRDRRWPAHRLAWFAHHGPIPEGYFVCHSCDNRRCIAIDHLFLGTPQQNITDMICKGRGRWRSRLRPEQVVDIKSRLLRGEPPRGIARRYGVGYGTVHAIKSGKNWQHVEATGVLPEGRARRRSAGDSVPIVEFPFAE
jgi:hypothetical protein